MVVWGGFDVGWFDELPGARPQLSSPLLSKLSVFFIPECGRDWDRSERDAWRWLRLVCNGWDEEFKGATVTE